MIPLKTEWLCALLRSRYWKVLGGFMNVLTSRMPSRSNLSPLHRVMSRKFISLLETTEDTSEIALIS